MRFDYVERPLTVLFSRHIRLVVSHPWPFIIIPTLITIVLSAGFGRLGSALIKDELELYAPINARAHVERQQIDQLFHIDDSDLFYAQRRYDLRRAGFILVTGQSEGMDILNPAILHTVLLLWTVILSLTVEDTDGRPVSYSSLCVQLPVSELMHRSLMSNCVANPLVTTLAYMKSADSRQNQHILTELNSTLNELTYPVTSDGIFIAHLLGGITLDDNKRVVGAKAVMLPYAVRHNSLYTDHLAELWELRLVDFILGYDSPQIDVSVWTYETLASESARDRRQLVHLLGPMFLAVLGFTIFCCCVGSWVRSRPYLAISGAVSSAMAIVSAIGLLLLMGFNFTSVAYSMPFIIFSIGVDNVFILLSAWRKTPIRLSFADRMAKTFSDAGVSITVTSVTDGISFAVGCMTAFPSVQMFCLYAAVAVAFVYFYQLTFFAGIMVLTSRREVAGLHCLTFRPVDDATNSSKRTIHMASDNKSKPLPMNENETLSHNHWLARFFLTSYSNLLLSSTVRMSAICTFIAYISLAAYGCYQLKVGFEPYDLLPGDSYAKKTLKLQEKYFADYGFYLHVWMYNLSSVEETLGRPRIWTILMREIGQYEHTEFTGYSDSWLRTFKAFVNTVNLPLNSVTFPVLLKDVFLARPQYANSSVLATGVYADFFLFAEQYDAVIPGTLTSIGMAGTAVVIVSLILIPQPSAAIWVSWSIISINVGVLGFMTFWAVRLDFISMVTIVMSIGFCVDFSAHLAYNFAKNPSLSRPDRVRNALYIVGTPILQSAASTILGVSFMSTVDSYVFRAFLKTVILVVVLGVLHGLLFLPVFLSFFIRSESEAEISTDQSLAAIANNVNRPKSKTTAQNLYIYRQQ